MARAAYIHGTDSAEQERLALLNRLTNAPFIEFLRLKEADSILEVGSGLGILAREVAQRVPFGEVVGIECSLEQLERAEGGLANLRFAQGDAHRLPFADDRFDVVYCRYVLEHVGDPGQVLREIRRVLKPGGRALAQENNILINVFDPDCPRFDAVWKQFVVLQSRLGGDALVGKRLFAMFRQAGFQDIELSLQPEVHWAGAPTFRPWVENLIGNVVGAAEKLQEYGLATGEEIEQAVAELRALMERPDSSALFYWNRASGRK